MPRITVKINFDNTIKDRKGKSIDTEEEVEIQESMPMKLTHALLILSQNYFKK